MSETDVFQRPRLWVVQTIGNPFQIKRRRTDRKGNGRRGNIQTPVTTAPVPPYSSVQSHTQGPGLCRPKPVYRGRVPQERDPYVLRVYTTLERALNSSHNTYERYMAVVPT